VDRTRTVTLYAHTVELRWISFVLVKVVLGILAVIFFHDGISFHLGEDRSRCDRNAEGVTLYECTLGNGDIGKGEGIDEDDLRYWRELCHGVRHRTFGGAENVDLVDYRGFNDSGDGSIWEE
jgi:hypothetical protein